MGFLRKLFARKDPFSEPCQCGGQVAAMLAPERESELSESRPVCVACLKPLAADALQTIGTGWVVVRPFSDAGCYVPYLLGELGDMDPWPSHLERLLPSSRDSCASCGAKTGGILWIETQQDASLRAFQDDRNWSDGRRGRVLCADCLAGLVTQTLSARGCKVWELVLPSGDPGVWLPWGY
jgi:hypothetical protein